jgi:DsbC/DsbD-like thiol-disulfide interchange protein
MDRHFRFAFPLVAILLFATSASLAESEKAADVIHATLVADVNAAAPGQSFTLGVLLKIQPHWHTYWVNPGETGNASEIHLRGPASFEFGAIQWPLPTKIDAEGSLVYGYEKEVLLMVPVKVAPGASASGSATIDADVKWLCCKETCLEGGTKLAISLPVSLDAKPANQPLFDFWKQRLPLSADSPAVAEVFGGIEQLGTADHSPNLKFVIHWKKPPTKVEWFPISTDAAVVENVVVKHEGVASNVAYKSTVYKPAEVPGGMIDSVVVYEEANGQRHGFNIRVKSK